MASDRGSITIAAVSRGWFPTVKGGSERFISRLCAELHKRGYRVVGITRRFANREEPRAPHELILLEEESPKPIASTLRFSRWAAKVVNSMRPSVVIVNSYWGESAPLFIDRSIPIIAVIHDVGLFRSEISKRNPIKHFLRVRVLKKVVSRVDVIVVPTESVLRDLKKFLGVDEAKVRVLGFEGVDGPLTFVHEDNELFDVVHVGRFAPNKGQIILLKAFERLAKDLQDAVLWLVGGRGIDPRDLRYLEEVKALAEKINAERGREVVHVVVDAPDVERFYRLADVCVAPSVAEEGFGLTVVECMAFGKPVIASDIFAETGVASSERALIVPRGDVEALYRALKWVYENRDKARELGLRGLEFAKKCSWSAVADFFESIVLELVKR